MTPTAMPASPQNKANRIANLDGREVVVRQPANLQRRPFRRAAVEALEDREYTHCGDQRSEPHMESVSGFDRPGRRRRCTAQRQPNLAAPERFSVANQSASRTPGARRRRRGRRLRERPASLPDSSLARRSKPRPAGAIGRSVKPLDRPGQTCQSGAMAKFRSSYVCQNCGAITQRWQGKCESCGEWNTIIEEAAALGIGGAVARRGAAGRPFPA